MSLAISVLMPIHNAAGYLSDAIESVLAQQGPEFELLLCDDASSDDSWQRAQAYADDPRVRLFRNSHNLGQGATRNRLAQQARGELLVPCDADDLLLPGNLEEHSQQMRQHPECLAVYSGVLVLRFQPDGQLSGPPELVAEDYRDYWDLQKNVINHGGCMLRRQSFLEAGGYEEDMKVADDWGLWLRLVDRGPLHFHSGFIGYLWRRHSQQCTQKYAQDLKRDELLLVQRTLARRTGRQVNLP